MSTFYVDSRRAWCTVAGGFVANFLLGGLAKSYGLIMEAFQDVFHSGSALFLLAGGLIYTLMYCLSLMNHYISQRYGSRPVVVVGALGSCVSLLVAAFAPSIAVWVVAVGVGVGASLSCIYFTVFAVVGRCFRRYLGLANGISVAGVSVGQMAFPSLITYLNQVYGTRGGTVVMSAICLHLLITAALMPRYIVDPENPGPPPFSNSTTEIKPKRRSKFEPTLDDLRSVTGSVASLVNGIGAKPKSSSFSHLYTELVDTEKRPDPMGDAPDDDISTKEISFTPKSGSVLSQNRKNEKRLIRALLAVYIVGKIFGDIGDVSVSFVAPSHGIHLGLSPVTVSRAIAFSGAVDLVARLGVGWLTDRPCCMGRRGILLALVWIFTGINALAFSALRGVETDDRLKPLPVGLLIGYFACFGIHGVCSGTAMTQMVIVLCDWVGSARLAHSLALTMFVLGVLISPGQFAVGYLADVTGSYVWPLRSCFLILGVAGACLLLEFPVRWSYSRSLTRNTTIEATAVIGDLAETVPCTPLEPLSPLR